MPSYDRIQNLGFVPEFTKGVVSRIWMYLHGNSQLIRSELCNFFTIDFQKLEKMDRSILV